MRDVCYRIVRVRVSLLFFFVCSCCCPRSALRSSETPKYRKSASWATEVRDVETRRFGLPRCRSAEYRHFGSPISLTKESFPLPVYIKASKFQCSSVYYWSSLKEDLLLFYAIKFIIVYTTFNILLSLTKSMFKH